MKTVTLYGLTEHRHAVPEHETSIRRVTFPPLNVSGHDSEEIRDTTATEVSLPIHRIDLGDGTEIHVAMESRLREILEASFRAEAAALRWELGMARNDLKDSDEAFNELLAERAAFRRLPWYVKAWRAVTVREAS
jgi:hypothetical protein